MPNKNGQLFNDGQRHFVLGSVFVAEDVYKRQDNRKVNYASINYVSNEDAIRLERYKTIINDILYARRGDVEKHAFIKEKDNGVLCGTGCLLSLIHI